MKRRHRLAPAVLVPALLALSCNLPGKPADKPSDTVRKFLGEKAVALLSDATTVEVYRVSSKRQGEPKDVKYKVEGYALHAPGKPQGKEFARRLNGVLFDEDTYLFDIAKGCKFQPGVAFRIEKDRQSVIVLLCFSCDELRVLTLEGEKIVHTAHEDFDPARATLVKLSKEAFPDDKEIQGLKEKKR